MAIEQGFCLDHVILLLPYDMLASPPSWLTDNFIISPGGRHGDNKTENRLVLFRDGTYLELIAFINDDPEKRKGHWWDKPYGVVDYAFTTAKLDYDGLVRRLKDAGNDVSYAEPKPGRRLRPDGQELKWEITFPTGVDRGNVPFFCTDVTPRERRVPITEENTSHPCGALGMAGMLLEIEGQRLDVLSKATAAALDQAYQSSGTYEENVPNDVPGLKKASVQLQKAAADSDKQLALTLRLQTAGHDHEEPIKQRIGDGLISITFE
jgi:hypothetical protein